MYIIDENGDKQLYKVVDNTQSGATAVVGFKPVRKISAIEYEILPAGEELQFNIYIDACFEGIG